MIMNEHPINIIHPKYYANREYNFKPFDSFSIPIYSAAGIINEMRLAQVTPIISNANLRSVTKIAIRIILIIVINATI